MFKMPTKKDSTRKTENDNQRFDVIIAFKYLEKSMNIFTGDDTYPVTSFFEEFENTASIMNWSSFEKLVYAKRLLSGTAKLCLRSLGSVKDYATLKKELEEEFGHKSNECAAVIPKTQNIKKTYEVSIKNLSIDELENMTEVDTGIDINLITDKEFQEINEHNLASGDEKDINDKYDEGKNKYEEKVLKINEDYDIANEKVRVPMDEEIETPVKSDLPIVKKDGSRGNFKRLHKRIQKRYFIIKEVTTRLKKAEDKDYHETKAHTKQRLKKKVQLRDKKQTIEADTRNLDTKTRKKLSNEISESIAIQKEYLRNYKKRRKKEANVVSTIDRVHLRQMNEQDGRVGRVFTII